MISILGRLFTLGVIVAAIYWYWQGPYQRQFNPSDAHRLDELREEIKLCIRTQNFKIDTGGRVPGGVEDFCADKHNAYIGDDGRWYSHEIPRY